MVSLLKIKAWQAFLFAGAATYLSVLLRILMILHANIPYEEYVDMGISVWDGLGGLVTLLWLYTLGVQMTFAFQEIAKIR